MPPEDREESETDGLVLMGTIAIEVYLNEDGELVHAAEISGLDTYQTVGVLEHVKTDFMFWPAEEES